MPQERTEEQILTKAPIEVTLGDEKYKLPILSVLKMAEWRRELIEVANDIGGLGVSLAALGTCFIAFPERLIDLVFAYCPDLPKDKLRETATEEQFVTAFSAIIPVAFPFMRQLSLMKSVMLANQSASGKSTNSSSTSTASHQIM
jgi:hypothetical protein